MSVSPVYELHGVLVLDYSEDLPVIERAADANELMGAALQWQADWVSLPCSRLSPAFFRLSSGMAGELVQQFANYRISLAIIGPWPDLREGRALGDFVREANRGRTLWFVADRREFEQKLKVRREALA